MMSSFRLLQLLWLLLLCLPAAAVSRYEVGAAIHDITGPASNLMMNGYVRKDQKTGGIHLRLHSRAFVILDTQNDKRVVLVNTELCNLYEGVKEKVMVKLVKKYGGLYLPDNVHIAANHTHSGPAGYSHHDFYNFRVGGFNQQNFDIIVDGIVESVVKAHNNMESAQIFVESGNIVGGNINRSLKAYLRNPASERVKYAGSTDTKMTQLKFVSDNGTPIGVYNWYPVHNVSMDNQNLLISSDNKGTASYLFEAAFNRDYRKNKGFVAAFANANAGDVSPGTAKDVDGDTDWECKANENFACTLESGMLQFKKAQQLFNRRNKEITGPIDFRHIWINFPELEVHPPYVKNTQKTCKAAIGLSMLAGSHEDGPGVGKEGVYCDKLTGALAFLCKRDPCHGQKPIVIQMGRKQPQSTAPQILPIQLFRLGHIAIAGAPIEFTTMAGRRLRNQLEKTLRPLGIKQVVLGGYANSFASYVATQEEYQEQMYEGASTLFGEWTLNAYQQEFDRIALDMVQGIPSKTYATPLPLPQPNKFVSAISGKDVVPSGMKLGDVVAQPPTVASVGKTIQAWFLGAQLSHDPKIQGSYFQVQKNTSGGWIPVAFDWDIDTKLFWTKRQGDKASYIGVHWTPPLNTPVGEYRIVYSGKALVRSKSRRFGRGSLRFLNFQGVTDPFKLETSVRN